jgi:hypothetical protein
VWRGVAWCGVAWRGVAWRGVAWCGVAWCGVVWCGMVWCGVIWRGVALVTDGRLRMATSGVVRRSHPSWDTAMPHYQRYCCNAVLLTIVLQCAVLPTIVLQLQCHITNDSIALPLNYRIINNPFPFSHLPLFLHRINPD